MRRFTYHQKREWRAAAQRSVVMGRSGMVATSHPLACLSGYRAIRKGGNAVDAAVAMAATLSVVEPYSVGIGGDCFGLFFPAGRPKAGRDECQRPGTPGGGRATVAGNGVFGHARPGHAIRHHAGGPGRLGRCGGAFWPPGPGRCLEDAIGHAEKGFAVSEVIAGEWASVEQMLGEDAHAARTFYRGAGRRCPDRCSPTRIWPPPTAGSAMPERTFSTRRPGRTDLGFFHRPRGLAEPSRSRAASDPLG